MESTLGKRISTYRKQMGLTQDQLAEKLGLTAQAVSKWENDLSCPDITVLPKLADIFGITTDELLGREAKAPIYEAEIITDPDNKDNGFIYDNGKMDFHWEGIKLEGIGLAIWVILTGILYLVAQLVDIDVRFWDILWPSFLLVLGLLGLYPKFSAFRLGCALVGCYFLVSKLQLLSIQLDNGVIIAIAVVLFGLGLLADALRKNKRSGFAASYTDRQGKVHHGKTSHDFRVDRNSFTYEASFGSSTQIVTLDRLQYGQISTNFGEYTVDLTGIEAVDTGCRIDTECSFGELNILVPRCYNVLPDSSTSFASFDIKGQPDSVCAGVIHLNASVSFGEICVRYL